MTLAGTVLDLNLIPGEPAGYILRLVQGTGYAGVHLSCPIECNGQLLVRLGTWLDSPSREVGKVGCRLTGDNLGSVNPKVTFAEFFDGPVPG